MTTNNKTAPGDNEGGTENLGSDTRRNGSDHFYSTTDDRRLSTEGRKLAEIESAMEDARDDSEWVDLYLVWLDQWAEFFADLMMAGIPFEGEPMAAESITEADSYGLEGR